MTDTLIEEVLDDPAQYIPEETIDDNYFDGDGELDEVELSEDDAEFIEQLVLRSLTFLAELCDVKHFPYQNEIAYRVVESILINDGSTITVEQARQSGKSEVLANVIATMMVLLPRFAKAWPNRFGKFAKGFLVGVFAPTDEQADTVWGRVVDRLSSERATEFMLDPEIDDKVTKQGGKSKSIRLKNSGSLCRRQTCNPKAKIESKTYHFILIDECQEADSFVVEKSISPMGAFTNATKVYTGTPTRTKNIFYKTIQQNKRRQVRRGVRQCHFSYDYKFVCKYNPNYRKYIAKEKAALGEDSDEFQLSYCCKWLIDQGMFVTEDALMQMGDPGMKIHRSWFKSEVVVGIDPARTKDSTVVTVVWVDWDHPDPFGYYEHRILSWLEIHNQEWEKQYYAIVDFLSNYRMRFIGVDTTGMGSAVFERIRLLFPDVECVECPSDSKTQSARWKHLKALMERGAFVYPAHSTVRRTRPYKRFIQQMTDLETKFQGPYMLAEAPEDNDAHDDYADSAAIACSLSLSDTLEESESFDSPWATRRR